jgi:hypothetical protein
MHSGVREGTWMLGVAPALLCGAESLRTLLKVQSPRCEFNVTDGYGVPRLPPNRCACGVRCTGWRKDLLPGRCAPSRMKPPPGPLSALPRNAIVTRDSLSCSLCATSSCCVSKCWRCCRPCAHPPGFIYHAGWSSLCWHGWLQCCYVVA